MKQAFITILYCCFLLNLAAQKTSAYFTFQYNTTLRDATYGNNPSGMGIGSQIFLGQKQVKPMAELTADLYLYDDKVYRMYSDGTSMETVGGMVNLFPGFYYHFTKNAFVSFSAGPSLIGKICFGVKPTIGFVSGTEKWFAKISYINIYNRDPRTKQDFTSGSISIGIKMF